MYLSSVIHGAHIRPSNKILYFSGLGDISSTMLLGSFQAKDTYLYRSLSANDSLEWFLRERGGELTLCDFL